jgi:hypothetical protein
MCMYMCACVRVCVCVCERERERERVCVCVCVTLVIQRAMRMRHIVTCDLSGRPYHIFPHDIKHATIFGKTLLKMRCVP